MKYSLEKIEWVDHSSFTESRWRFIESYEDKSLFTVVTIGYVVRERDDSLIVISTISNLDSEDEADLRLLNDMTILKCAIKSRTKLIESYE